MVSAPKARVSAEGLDRTSGVPLHVQVEQHLQRLSQQAPYAEGASLPDELTLARQLGLSRGTVRDGILKLVQRGILERKKRAGTRVVQSDPVGWANMTGEMKSKGIAVETFHYEITRVPAPTKAAIKLGIPENLSVQCLNMTEGWNGQPAVHSLTWFHPRIKLSGQEDLRDSHYKLLSEISGVTADHAREEFMALGADRYAAERLSIAEGLPLLLRCRTSLDRENNPIDYAEAYYWSQGVPLTLTTRRGSERY